MYCSKYHSVIFPLSQFLFHPEMDSNISDFETIRSGGGEPPEPPRLSRERNPQTFQRIRARYGTGWVNRSNDPVHWVMYRVGPNTRPFYRNLFTREYTWVAPTNQEIVQLTDYPIRSDEHPDWYVYNDRATERLYYSCRRTGATTWVPPPLKHTFVYVGTVERVYTAE